MTPILELKGLEKAYPKKAGFFAKPAQVHALNGVDLAVARGEFLGIVGESGSGKSTLARQILRLEPPTKGEIRLGGVDLTRLSDRELRPFRKRMQIVFQDPNGSLNPRMRVEDVLGEALRLHSIVPRAEISGRIDRLLDRVGLPSSARRKLPHEFSGGQRQRIGIARALSVEPELLVADEPLSSLDVSVQAQILNLLAELRAEMKLTLILISHDLKVVERVADRIAVLYLGRVVEVLSGADADRALHPYTRALRAAVPSGDPSRRRDTAPVPGESPSPIALPPGCAFAARCPIAVDTCRREVPPLTPVGPHQAVACPPVSR